MWILELSLKHVPKIMKTCALRNSQIVFSRGRGFIFQGFQHLQKLAKNASKWRLNWAQNQENVVQRPLKNSLEKHIKKTWKMCSEYLPKWRPKKWYLGWILRSGGKGAPRVLPRALPGTSWGQIYEKKVPKWRPNVMKKLCFSRFNWRPNVIGSFFWGWQG